MKRQSVASALSNIRVDSASAPEAGKISILRRPTDASDLSTQDSAGAAASQSSSPSKVGPSSATAATAATAATVAAAPTAAGSTATGASSTAPTTSASSSSSASPSATVPSATSSAKSSSTSPAPSSTPAAEAGGEASAEELSKQNRRRREILKAEMNFRKECEVLGGDYTPNPDWGLMEAEWLESIPPDFEKKWIVVPCPVGKRCSLWALDGETHAYTKQGMFLESFESLLPNGFHYSSDNGSTFLDTVYCENLSTFFALDVLQWDDYDLRRGSAEFRLYDLQTRMADQMSGLPPSVRSRFNKFVMQLPLFPCTPTGIARALTWSPLPNLKLELDGILLYHHDAMYTPGTTPLVAWIKPWMAPEIFSNVRVPPHLLTRKPNLYKDRLTFMKEWNDKEARLKAKRENKAGRKSNEGPSIPKSPSTPSASSAAAAAAKKEEEEDEEESLPAIEDDPAWTVAAVAAKRSDNSLLALIGDNILDTLGGLSLDPQP